MDLKYSDGYGSQIFIGDNVTLFAVDRANRTTTAMTLTVVDHQLSSLEYDTNDVDQIWSMYDKWLTGLLTDTGIPLPGANDSFIHSPSLSHSKANTICLVILAL